MSRKLFLQREVIEIGNVLGWKMTKQNLYYWQMRGHFPEPVAKVSNTSWYKYNDVISGFLAAGQHFGREYGRSNIELAIKAVLENNKKLTQEMLKYKREVCDGKKP